MIKEKIMTLHPQGKKGVNIDKEKYDQIKDYVLDVIKNHSEITYQELDKLAVRDLQHNFDGKVGWYLVTVKLDLEARGMIQRIPKSSPHKIRLA